MSDSEIIESCIKDIRRLLAEDNESINAMQRDVTLLCRLKPDNKNQLDNMLFKFNEERLKALLALTRSKIVMTDVISLITELRANLEKSSEKPEVDGNNKSENNISSTKTPSPSTSYRKPSEHNRESPPSSLNKTATLIDDSVTIHLLPILKNDPSPPQNKATNVERKSNSNKRKISADNLVPTKQPSRPMSESSIDFYGTEDAILPDVELSRHLQNIQSNQVTGLSAPEQSFNFKIPKKSDTVYGKPTLNIKPAQHTGDPDKFKIKKVLESNTSRTPKDQPNNDKHNKVNVLEPTNILTNTNRHIPVAPVAATLKKRASLITLPSTDSTLKSKKCCEGPFTTLPPNNDRPPPLICPKNNQAPILESPRNDQSLLALKRSHHNQTPTSETPIDKTPSRAKRRNSYDSLFTSKCPKKYTSPTKSNREKDQETPRSRYSNHYQRPSTPKYPSQSPKYQGIISRSTSRDPRISRRNQENKDARSRKRE